MKKLEYWFQVIGSLAIIVLSTIAVTGAKSYWTQTFWGLMIILGGLLLIRTDDERLNLK